MRQIPREFGDRLKVPAIARRSNTADQCGLAWTFPGAALLAIGCDEADVAQDFAGRARELLDAIGGSDGEVGMLQSAGGLLRGGTPIVLDDVSIAAVARLMAETAAEQRGCPETSEEGRTS